MKKTYKLKDLDCANCAAKMEAAISKMPGVEQAQISFMSQRFTLQAPDDRFEALLADAQKVMRRIEPQVRVIL